jgi:Adenylate and Guanylate cyclase catalytic domain/Double zinc ribbon
MRCSKCGFDNFGGMKFCGQCATPLALVCPNCNLENPPRFKFCGQCTTALGPDLAKPQSSNPPITTSERDGPAAVDGERKTVTALFADIKGSTELMEDLDPEEARAIIDPALRIMIEGVRRYDGYVVQSTGDGIFVLFGAPVAHEDHPQRALYAALRMQEDLRRYSSRVVSEGGTPVQARIGVNTRGWYCARSTRVKDTPNTLQSAIAGISPPACRPPRRWARLRLQRRRADCVRATSHSNYLGRPWSKELLNPKNSIRHQN